MEAPEIPIFEENSPVQEQGGEGGEGAALPHQSPEVTLPAAGLTLTLTPTTAAGDATPADADAPRRCSLDTASSVHSDWELLSAGHHSHCGSSPSSVSASEAYDSEHEGEHGPAQGQVAAAEVQPEGLNPVALAIEPATQPAMAGTEAPSAAVAPSETSCAELEAESFGSLVLPTQPAVTAAVGVECSERTVLTAAKAGVEGEGGLPLSLSDSPRSSYERPSSRASRHDLYSLSQDGSIDNLSEDDYIGDMMMQGEPDHPAGSDPIHAVGAEHDGSEGERKEAELLRGKPSLRELTPLHALASAPAATVAAAARGAYCTASRHLRELAASVSAVLARFVPTAAGAAQHVMRGVAEIVDSLRERMATLPQELAPLAHVVSPSVGAVSDKAQMAVQRTRKQLGCRQINWAKVALVLGVTCSGLALALYRSWAEQARLGASLAKREADLSRLLSKVMELQRNISNRQVPLVRHVSAATTATPFWPAVIVV